MSAILYSASFSQIPPTQVGPKYVSETRAYSGDFTNLLGTDTIQSVTSVMVSVINGIDTNPQAILLGSPNISGSEVIQEIQAGVAGVQYMVSITIETGLGNILTGKFTFYVVSG